MANKMRPEKKDLIVFEMVIEIIDIAAPMNNPIPTLPCEKAETTPYKKIITPISANHGINT